MPAMWGTIKLTPIVVVIAMSVLFLGCSSQPSTAVAVSVTSGARPGPDTARRNLTEDESRGGHTLKKHVGKSDDELRARLDREHITAASTYTDIMTAEQTVGTAVHREADRVQSWAQRQGRKPDLAIDFHGGPSHPIGRTMHRGDSTSQPCANAVVVLKSDGSNGYFVLTSYPECQ